MDWGGAKIRGAPPQFRRLTGLVMRPRPAGIAPLVASAIQIAWMCFVGFSRRPCVGGFWILMGKRHA